MSESRETAVLISSSIPRFVVLLSALIAALTQSACIGTSHQTDRVYSDLARSQHLALRHDGYIVAVEKRPRKSIGMTCSQGEECFDTERFKLLDGRDDKTRKRNREFIDVMTNPEPMLVSHVVPFFDRGRGSIYNAYDENGKSNLDYASGWKALDDLQFDLRDRLDLAAQEGKPYTHLLVFSMGWNNDQFESIRRYNLMLDALKKASDERGAKNFRPLAIGLTWPSVWFSLSDSRLEQIVGHIGSYFIKANDADEVGYTAANWLVNRIARDTADRESKSGRPLRIVLIGHSLGARLLSRAIFADSYLKEPPTGPQVDLYLGLQGAFSASRFIDGAGYEGYPYAELGERATRFVLTSSTHDKANPPARYVTRAFHIGGHHGLKRAEQEPKAFITPAVKWPLPDDRFNGEELFASGNRALIVDAQSIVCDHNDILDDEMGRLVWAAIEAFAPLDDGSPDSTPN